MKFVCIGTMVPEQYEVKIAALSNASNRFLWNLTNATIRQNHEVERLSYMGIPVDAKTKIEIQEETDKRISYIWKTKNIISGVLNCHKAIKRKLENADCLLAYNVVYAWLFAPIIAHWLHKKSILVLADFSDTDSYSRLKGKLYASVQKWSIRRFDKVIGLSQNTEGLLRKNQQFVLMEGGINREFYDEFSTPDLRDGEQIIFMYAGILEKVTGIDLLLQAFMDIRDPHAKLLISGRGSMEVLVRVAQEKDARIQYLGCPAYEEYMQNLHKADILINPRNMNLPENKNNFPSKIMEYLATGKPILSTRFPGWERFEEYVSFCDADESDMKKRLMEMTDTLCRKQVLMHRVNRSFAEKYLWDKQVGKITED